MKITVCGSIAFIKEMEWLANQLIELGHKAEFPPTKIPGEKGELIPALEYYKHKKALPADDKAWIWKHHFQRIKDHFDKVEWAEAILVANFDKNNIVGYIGPNTLMEMGLAFHLGKKIYLLNPIPELAWKEEILGMKPVVIEEDLK